MKLRNKENKYQKNVEKKKASFSSSLLLWPLDSQDNTHYGNTNKEKYHRLKRTTWCLFLILFRLLNVLSPFDHLLIAFLNIEIDPIKQRSLQYHHSIELFVQVIELMNRLNDFENLLIPRGHVHIQLLLLNEIHPIV